MPGVVTELGDSQGLHELGDGLAWTGRQERLVQGLESGAADVGDERHAEGFAEAELQRSGGDSDIGGDGGDRVDLDQVSVHVLPREAHVPGLVHRRPSQNPRQAARIGRRSRMSSGTTRVIGRPTIGPDIRVGRRCPGSDSQAK